MTSSRTFLACAVAVLCFGAAAALDTVTVRLCDRRCGMCQCLTVKGCARFRSTLPQAPLLVTCLRRRDSSAGAWCWWPDSVKRASHSRCLCSVYFAEPPVDSLRWEAPVMREKFMTPFNATQSALRGACCAANVGG